MRREEHTCAAAIITQVGDRDEAQGSGLAKVPCFIAYLLVSGPGAHTHPMVGAHDGLDLDHLALLVIFLDGPLVVRRAVPVPAIVLVLISGECGGAGG